MKRDSALTGAAGAYYVASTLTLLGYNAALTLGNAPGVDILVSSPKGSSGAAIQVKTSAWALRTRGSGANKVPHHYDWAVGKKLALANEPNLLVALVDLKDPEQDGQIDELPDVYLVRSTQIYDYFQESLQLAGKSQFAMWRYWPSVEDIAPYKNSWDILRDCLNGDRGASA